MAAKIALLVLSLLYPLAWYVGREQGWFPFLAGAMALLWLLRALLQTPRAQKILSLIIAAFFALALAARLPQSMYAYPVLVNLLLLGSFAYSLRHPPSAIETLARLQTPDLPPQAVAYTRRLTQIWCVFFLVNAAVAACLALAGLHTAWALYTGIISYLLMGILLGGEWLYRRKVIMP